MQQIPCTDFVDNVLASRSHTSQHFGKYLSLGLYFSHRLCKLRISELDHFPVLSTLCKYCWSHRASLHNALLPSYSYWQVMHVVDGIHLFWDHKVSLMLNWFDKLPVAPYLWCSVCLQRLINADSLTHQNQAICPDHSQAPESFPKLEC